MSDSPYDGPAGGGHACPECGEDFTGMPLAAARLAQHRKRKHGVIGAAPSKKRKPAETPPRDTTGDPAPAAKAEKPPGERRPQTPRKPRVRLDRLGRYAWRGLGRGAANAGFDAAGRCFEIQAEAAGPAIEEAVKGTILDRVVQPIARILESSSKLGTLVALPVAAESFRRQPTAFTRVAFVEALEESLPHIAASVKTVKRRQERLEADLSDLAEAFGKPAGSKVSIDEIAAWILGGNQTDQPASPPGSEPAAA